MKPVSVDRKEKKKALLLKDELRVGLSRWLFLHRTDFPQSALVTIVILGHAGSTDAANEFGEERDLTGQVLSLERVRVGSPGQVMQNVDYHLRQVA